MQQQSYSSASALALDASFQEWVQHPTPENAVRWEQWIQQEASHQQLADEARRMLLLLKPAQADIPDHARQHVWQRLQASIKIQPTVQKASVLTLVTNPFQRIYRTPSYRWAAVAAIVVVLMGGAYWSFFMPRDTEVATTVAEIKTLTLPDGSTVVLNANSTLTYDARWDGTAERSVTLSGEAFFKVTKQNVQGQGVKFLVRTKYATVEVLGTQFNVNTRRERTAVVLNEGRVRLVSPTANSQVIDLRPGEKIELTAQGSFTKTPVNPDVWTSWKDNKLIFNGASLHDVAQLLQDNYNVTVIFEDDELANLNFTGGVPANDLDKLVRVIAEAFSIEVTRTEQTIVVRRKR